MCVMPARRRTSEASQRSSAADRGPKSLSLRRSKGRQAAPDDLCEAEQRRRRLGAVKLHPVSYAIAAGSKDRQCPWSTAVRQRLDDRRLDADCHRPLGGYSSCSLSAAAGRKGGRPPFSAPPGCSARLLCWFRKFSGAYFCLTSKTPTPIRQKRLCQKPSKNIAGVFAFGVVDNPQSTPYSLPPEPRSKTRRPQTKGFLPGSCPLVLHARPGYMSSLIPGFASNLPPAFVLGVFCCMVRGT